MAAKLSSSKFDQLPYYFDKDVESFGSLLPHLSQEFASKNPEVLLDDIDVNLDRITQNKNDTALLVHSAEDEQILATITANRVFGPRPEGWIDDVVTHPDFVGRGLGRAAMNAAHDWFRQQNVSTVRLTSTADKKAAGNLYSDLGYEQGGTVWRAKLDRSNTGRDNPNSSVIARASLSEIYDLRYGTHPVAENAAAEEYDELFDAARSDTSAVIFDKNNDGEIIRTAVAANCRIPTGNKAWLYGLKAENVVGLVNVIQAAHRVLADDGIESANIMTFPNSVDEDLLTALDATGYRPRSTRLYSLDLGKN